MTTFTDGPAMGESMALRRNPILLRVTQNGPVFDALDQFGDEPEETELIYVYQLIETPRASRLTPAGRIPVARYRYLDPQPTDPQVRLTHAWRGWTTAYARRHSHLLPKH